MMTSGSRQSGGAGWMARILPSPTQTVGQRALWRIWLRLVPYLFFLYILAYLDRVNVSVAGLRMQDSIADGGLGFDRAMLGFGAGIFFWGYWILEIPSTVSVARLGARWVFVRVLILWGICAALVGTVGTPFAGHLLGWLPHISEQSGFVTGVDGTLQHLFGVQPAAASAHFFNGLGDNPAYQFYFFRFMLGFFEGGFFPSVIVYLSQWFRTDDRAKAIATFMSAIPISTLIGSPLSGLLLGVHWFDIAGWRWIFILEGVSPVLAGFATIFLLPNRPEEVRWLPADERAWLVGELERERQAKKTQPRGSWRQHLGMVGLLTLVYFCLNVTSYGVSMFMPEIIKSQTHLSNRDASVLASVPYLLALIAMLLNGWHSDRRRERPWHVAVPLALLGIGLWLTASLDGSLWAAVAMIALVGTFLYAHLGPFWSIPTKYLGATAAASAIGFINMIGNLGGSVGPWMVGEVSKGQSSFAPALTRLMPWPLAAAGIVLVLRYTCRSAPVETTPAPLATTRKETEIQT
jgi:MFS transporter, ACS family, tartrate transporter